METLNKKSEFQELCRLCLSNSSDMVSIFDAHIQDLSSKIYECVSIQVLPDDGLPKSICGDCSGYIRGWTTFKEQCKRTDSVLHQHVQQRKHSESKCTEFELKLIKQEYVALTAEDEVNNVNENDALPFENVCSLFDNGTGNVQPNECEKTDGNVKHLTNAGAVGEICQASEKYCIKCGETFAIKNVISYHTCDLGIEGTFRYVCNVCGKDYSSAGAVRTHLQMHKGKHRCSTCGKCFPSRFQVEVHSRMHTREKPLVCEYCGHTFAHNRGLLLHVSTVHASPTQVHLYCCNQCGYTTPSRSYLESHSAVHAARKPFVCEVCGRGYTLFSSLATHQANHSDVKNFECETCNKTFHTRRKLASHMVVHNAVRPFHCEDCGKQFARKEGLRDHRVIHTGEKRYNCSKCHKSFAWRKILRTHKCIPDLVDSD